MKKRTLLAFTLILCPALASATSSPELMKQVSDQVGAIQDALDASTGSLNTPAISSTEDAWFFKNIWIRLTTPIGFSVPGLVSVSAIPTFEMLVQRPIPAGWQVYQPPANREASAVTPD